ncbi:MAG TPA: cupin domain-containing protein [Ktedonobacterales bacterium]
MRIFRADKLPGRSISQFASVGAEIVPVARPTAEAQVVVLRLMPGGKLGLHQTNSRQLFIVMNGSGAVRAGDEPPLPVTVGDMVLWESGEWHETTTEAGLLALLVEADALEM